MEKKTAKIDNRQLAINVLSSNPQYDLNDIHRVINYNKLDMKLKREYILFLKKCGFSEWRIKDAFGFKDKRNIIKLIKKYEQPTK